MMSQLLDHSARKKIFSWEKKPGVSNEINTDHSENLIQREHEFSSSKLPPPPCSTEASAAKNLVHDIQIPLPPCTFQPPYYNRTNSLKKGLWNIQDGDDPFLAAYKECTKNQNIAKRNNRSESRLRRSLSFFSCKRSSTVCDDNLVRSSHFSKS